MGGFRQELTMASLVSESVLRCRYTPTRRLSVCVRQPAPKDGRQNYALMSVQFKSPRAASQIAREASPHDTPGSLYRSSHRAAARVVIFWCTGVVYRKRRAGRC